jgi:C-terminal processing protease CtpA/Prc
VSLRSWRSSPFRLILSSLVLGAVFLYSCLCVRASETFSEQERLQVLEILHTTENDLRTQYYDPKFHGVDIHARFQQAESRINASKSYLEAIGSVEWAIAGLNDSHTYLIPPAQPFEIDYGFRFQFYGDSCYVTQVKRESDAEKQGLKVGDQLLALDGAKLIRSQYTVLERSMNLLAPRAKVQLAFLSSGDKTLKTITVETKVNRILLGDLNSVIQRMETMQEKSKPVEEARSLSFK